MKLGNVVAACDEIANAIQTMKRAPRLNASLGRVLDEHEKTVMRFREEEKKHREEYGERFIVFSSPVKQNGYTFVDINEKTNRISYRTTPDIWETIKGQSGLERIGDQFIILDGEKFDKFNLVMTEMMDADISISQRVPFSLIESAMEKDDTIELNVSRLGDVVDYGDLFDKEKK